VSEEMAAAPRRRRQAASLSLGANGPQLPLPSPPNRTPPGEARRPIQPITSTPTAGAQIERVWSTRP